MKWYGLADCNNFYVSCERIFNLSLVGVPVVVLSNNDGCVISRSKEAKDLGVKMGVPIHEIKYLVMLHNIQIFSSNYALYGDISARVMNSLKDLCPEVEVYSIDESFIDLSIFSAEELHQVGVNIKAKVRKWTKIPISIGIAPTKTLAKIANKYAKQDKESDGVFVMDSEAKRINILSKFAVEDVWGIGRQHAKYLQQKGIKTALELANMPDELIRKQFSVVGLRLVRELRGESCLPIIQERSMSKGICNSRSFGKSLMSFDNISEATATFASRCGEKLRRQKSCANVITVFVRTNPFSKTKPQYANSITLTCEVPTNSTQEIIKYVNNGLKMIFRKGYEYKKAGVIVTGIIPECQQQIGLFDSEDRPKLTTISNLMDKLNARFGRDTLTFAIQGTGKNWKPNARSLSPKFTTRWGDIPKVET